METPCARASGLVRSASYARVAAAAGMGRAMGRLSARVLRPRPYAPEGALQCAVVAFDIAGFGDRRRDDEVQLYVRAGLYRILEEAFEDTGVPWRECHREDRGDGVLIVVPALIATELLISPLTERVRAGLRRHNKLSSEPAQIRLRMALHAGHVHFDPYGVAGRTLVHAFRLLEAPAFKTAFAATGRELGCVVSDRLYDDVIRHGPGLIDPDLYDAISVSVKETEARAWVHFPPGAVRPALNTWPHVVAGA
ncbi:hypothetical protein [Actinoallomurus iriomotensis]|uniref:Guanylate cyclase domain-containing protein n=1 Tax=Actinoallomurus iriomotensis TaxID=478107 RepID=A0A9W6W2S3_9ACTN|nr:hypothetical protein [Actinoallomurus iriomotensis]GLY88162.1 hypothetical protein Airi02_060910 [Actinoallomurus iriomotensis]